MIGKCARHSVSPDLTAALLLAPTGSIHDISSKAHKLAASLHGHAIGGWRASGRVRLTAVLRAVRDPVLYVSRMVLIVPCSQIALRSRSPRFYQMVQLHITSLWFQRRQPKRGEVVARLF